MNMLAALLLPLVHSSFTSPLTHLGKQHLNLESHTLLQSSMAGVPIPQATD